MHEHHAVHELDTVGLTRPSHLSDFSFRNTAGFLTEDVLPGFRRLDDPWPTQGRRQRHINRINLVAAQKLFVAPHGSRSRIEGVERLTVFDEFLSFILTATRNRRHHRVVRMINGLPIFSADICSTEKAPATFSFHFVSPS